jgi:alpha-glucosidase (family GH31 glycosyl hydrolase)
VRVAPAGEPTPGAPSLAAPRDWPEVSFEVTGGEPARVVTSALRVEVATDPVRLSFADASGAALLHEPPLGGVETEPAAGPVRASFVFAGEQHFYGLGQGGGRLDRLGTMRQLWNTQLGHGPGSDLGVPLLISSRGYALFFDTAADASIAVGRSDGGVRITYSAARGPVAWYFLIGADLRALMGEVAELLGRAAMPPRWALGFLQSTRHFENTDELRRLPRTIRDKRIPCDALIYLSSYGEALGWNRGVGHLEFQPELWSKPAALLDEVRTQHFEVVTHEYPVLHEASPLFAEAEARGYLLATAYERSTGGVANYRQGQRLLDFSNPTVRAPAA